MGWCVRAYGSTHAVVCARHLDLRSAVTLGVSHLRLGSLTEPLAAAHGNRGAARRGWVRVHHQCHRVVHLAGYLSHRRGVSGTERPRGRTRRPCSGDHQRHHSSGGRHPVVRGRGGTARCCVEARVRSGHDGEEVRNTCHLAGRGARAVRSAQRRDPPELAGPTAHHVVRPDPAREGRGSRSAAGARAAPPRATSAQSGERCGRGIQEAAAARGRPARRCPRTRGVTRQHPHPSGSDCRAVFRRGVDRLPLPTGSHVHVGSLRLAPRRLLPHRRVARRRPLPGGRPTTACPR
ncbi:unannotated protein [freshwater metagenome]|uniref:Unannotated protein n=1 Tax=freshwater metagenome TaxID=449393 RepID=A0A6J7P3I3_9ZZZZ